MPPLGQPSEDAAELLDFDDAESCRLMDERSRTDSDKTILGIPADRNDYALYSNEDYDPSTGLGSAGQASRSRKSWGTMSATSHGTLHSSQDLDFPQYSQMGQRSVPIGTSAPHITLNGSSAESMRGTTGLYATSNADHNMTDSWFESFWPVSAGSSDPVPTTLGPMAFAPEGIYTDASWTGDIALENMKAPGLAQNDSVESADGSSPQPMIDLTSASETSCRPALSNPTIPNVDLHHLEEGDNKELVARQPKNKRGRPNAPKRANVDKINGVRSIGACFRCAVLKEQCDVGDPCLNCKTNAQKARIWKQPCVRLNLNDTVIHRRGALSFPDGIRKLTFESKENVVLSLYNVGFAPSPVLSSFRPNLRVVCKEFRAANGDPLSKSWISKGQKRDLLLPAYAIPPGHQKDLNENVDALLSTQFRSLLGELTLEQDEIIAMTLAEAIRHEGKCIVLRKALSIAVMTRLAMKSFNIIGPQTLGIPPVDDADSPYCGRIPIPPVLDAQLDYLWIGKMLGMRKDLLPQLNRWIKDKTKRRENWFMIFLTIFVLLSNLELIYQNQSQQRRRYEKTNALQDRMMESWKHAAETLVAYFHAICHGGVPLEMDWDEEAQQAANLDKQSLQFLSALKQLTVSRGRFLFLGSEACAYQAA